MGSGASFYLVGVSCQLSRKPILKTRHLRDFKLCSHRSSPYLPTGKAQVQSMLPHSQQNVGWRLIDPPPTFWLWFILFSS